MTEGINWSVEMGEAMAATGFLMGISDTINTDIYINAVVDRAWSLLNEVFEAWMDARAREDVRGFQHVYHWSHDFHDYSTVGEPTERLWVSYLAGQGRNRTATFMFEPEDRPTPINPILQEPGPSGRSVTSVHVFAMKASAMEYGAEITVRPKLAKYLAYVLNPEKFTGNSGGRDRFVVDKQRGVMLDEGPVHFEAGGGVTFMRFTTAYLEWWSTMAQGIYESDILPTLERDLRDTAIQYGTVKIGKNIENKSFSIGAGANADRATFEEARLKGIEVMKAQAAKYMKSTGVSKL